MADIDITGLDKAEVLAALVNGAPVKNFDSTLPADVVAMATALSGGFTVEAARRTLAISSYVDYAGGIAIKCDFSNDSFWPGLYDRDRGKGKAAAIVAALRKSKTL